jgi:hypothetical protein
MPKLGIANLATLQLPSSVEGDPATVTMDLNISAGLVLDAAAQGTAEAASIQGLALAITAWNFTEDDGTTLLPITPENVRRLNFADFNFLDRYLTARMNEQTAEAVPANEKKVLV